MCMVLKNILGVVFKNNFEKTNKNEANWSPKKLKGGKTPPDKAGNLHGKTRDLKLPFLWEHCNIMWPSISWWAMLVDKIICKDVGGWLTNKFNILWYYMTKYQLMSKMCRQKTGIFEQNSIFVKK